MIIFLKHLPMLSLNGHKTLKRRESRLIIIYSRTTVTLTCTVLHIQMTHESSDQQLDNQTPSSLNLCTATLPNTCPTEDHFSSRFSQAESRFICNYCQTTWVILVWGRPARFKTANYDCTRTFYHPLQTQNTWSSRRAISNELKATQKVKKGL